MNEIRNELTNKEFGRLVVIERAENIGKAVAYKCLCECGKETIILYSNLLRSNGKGTKSCGCLQAEVKTKHGMAGTRIHRIWKNMKTRCYNKNFHRYSDYGGRGIFICNEWKDDFSVFAKWAMENGYVEDLSIERLDNNGPYSPNNCKWATAYEQTRNTRSNNHITHNGKTKILSDWAKDLGLQQSVVGQRMRNYGWSVEMALTTPSMGAFGNG